MEQGKLKLCHVLTDVSAIPQASSEPVEAVANVGTGDAMEDGTALLRTLEPGLQSKSQRAIVEAGEEPRVSRIRTRSFRMLALKDGECKEVFGSQM